jgi:K+-transporting ATPase KdpF subunit
VIAEVKMNAEYVVNGLIALGLLAYLGYALLRPERL